MVAWQAGQAGVAKMELEVSYDENYCMEGRAERRRGATDSTGEAVQYLKNPLGFARILNASLRLLHERFPAR